MCAIFECTYGRNHIRSFLNVPLTYDLGHTYIFFSIFSVWGLGDELTLKGFAVDGASVEGASYFQP